MKTDVHFSSCRAEVFLELEILQTKALEKIKTHEDRCTFSIMSRRSLLRIRNVADQSIRENQNTRFMFSNFSSENRAVYEIM